MSQKRPPIGSSVRLLKTLETKGLSKIPEGTVGIVQEHCENRELKVKFKLCNATVEVNVHPAKAWVLVKNINKSQSQGGFSFHRGR